MKSLTFAGLPPHLALLLQFREDGPAVYPLTTVELINAGLKVAADVRRLFQLGLGPVTDDFYLSLLTPAATWRHDSRGGERGKGRGRERLEPAVLSAAP